MSEYRRGRGYSNYRGRGRRGYGYDSYPGRQYQDLYRQEHYEPGQDYGQYDHYDHYSYNRSSYSGHQGHQGQGHQNYQSHNSHSHSAHQSQTHPVHHAQTHTQNHTPHTQTNNTQTSHTSSNQIQTQTKPTHAVSTYLEISDPSLAQKLQDLDTLDEQLIKARVKANKLSGEYDVLRIQLEKESLNVDINGEKLLELSLL